MRRYINKLPYFICYLVAFAFGIKQMREPDIWWQILSGKWMLAHGAVTRKDMFSYTMAGHPWENVKWLYEVVIAAITKIMGPEGIMLLQAVINVVIVYLLLRVLKMLSKQVEQHVSMFFTVTSVLLFLGIVEYRMAGRPEMISHLFSTVFIFFLFRYPRLEWKKVFWLVLLQCLWANMHEGYPVGLVLLGCFTAGSLLAYLIRKDKDYLQQTLRALSIFAAGIIIILINPNGMRLWVQPFEIYRQVWANKYTTELYSFRQAAYWTVEAKWHIALLVLVTIFWITKLMKARKEKDNKLFTPVVLTYLILVPLFGYLSLTANRNIIFSEIVLLPSVPIMCTSVLERLKMNEWLLKNLQSRTLFFSSALAALFYIFVVSNGFYKYTKSPNRYGFHISMLHNPIGAANFIKQHNIQGPAFSDYFISSYLLWDLYPNFKSYIDLRDLDVFPAPFFDEYFSIYNHPDKFHELDKKYNFNYVVLSTSQLVGLQLQLFWKEGYYLIYADPVSVIYLKQNAQNKPLIDNRQIQQFFSWPQAPDDPAWATLIAKLLNPMSNYDDEDEQYKPVYAANFYNAMQDYPDAIKLLLPNMGNLQDYAPAYRTLGNSYMEYSKVTKDPALQQQRRDSAMHYFNQLHNMNDE